MYFVQCPRCGTAVELPSDAIGRSRSAPWNVTECVDCDLSFDFEDEEVQHAPEIDGVFLDG